MNNKVAVCLDTNILMNLFEPNKHEAKTFNKFLTAVLTGKCQLILVDQVLIEWERHIKKSQEDFINKIYKEIDEYKSLTKYTDEKEKIEIENTLDKIKRLQVRKFKYNYGKRAEKIDDVLNDSTYTKTIRRTRKAEEIIVQKSINKEPPFFYNEFSNSSNKVKNESADAAIFFTLYDNIKSNTIKYDNIYFITDNKKDFSDPANPAKIHENLKVYADEVNITFSNNIKGLMDSLIDDKEVIAFFEDDELLSGFLTDKYFTICSKCKGEVHLNADSYLSEGPPHQQTYWLECPNCKNKWDTGDLVHDLY